MDILERWSEGLRQKMFLFAARLCSRLMTIEIAVIARIAMVAALIPRTIIAHTRGRIFMMSPCAYDGAACAVRAHLTFDSILDDK